MIGNISKDKELWDSYSKAVYTNYFRLRLRSTAATTVPRRVVCREGGGGAAWASRATDRVGPQQGKYCLGKLLDEKTSCDVNALVFSLTRRGIDSLSCPSEPAKIQQNNLEVLSRLVANDCCSISKQQSSCKRRYTDSITLTLPQWGREELPLFYAVCWY